MPQKVSLTTFSCVAIIITVSAYRSCAQNESQLEERWRESNIGALAQQLAELGPNISNTQYRDLLDLYFSLCRRSGRTHQACEVLETTSEYYMDLQDKLLDEGWNLGRKLLVNLHSTSSYLNFKTICAKIDIFKTKSTDPVLRMHILPHFEDSEKFVHFDSFRQTILAEYHQYSTIQHFFYRLLSCFGLSIANSAADVDGHDQVMPDSESDANSRDENLLNRHSAEVEEDMHAETVESMPSPESQNQTENLNPNTISRSQSDNAINAETNENDDLNIVIYLFSRNAYRLILNVPSYLTNIRLSSEQFTFAFERIQETLEASPLPISLPTMLIPGHTNEECEEFLNRLQLLESILTEDLNKMQEFAKHAGLLLPSQTKQWRIRYQNFLEKLTLMGINSELFLKIVLTLKKEQKDQADRAIEAAVSSWIRYAYKYVDEIARMERAMEAKRRLPNSWQTYCDMCMSPFQFGDNLTVMELLEFPEHPVKQAAATSELSVNEARRQIEALKEPEAIEESAERKQLVLLSAIEEAELFSEGQSESLPQDIVFCASCGYRCCRACIEKTQRMSACRCPVCSQTLLVPTVKTLMTFCS